MDSVWVASKGRESGNYFQAFAVYATPELAMAEINKNRRKERQEWLDEYNTEYPPEMKHREEVEAGRAMYAKSVRGRIKWDVTRDENGNITECYGDDPESEPYQIAPYPVIASAQTS